MTGHGQEVFPSASSRLVAGISRVNRILPRSVSIAIREKAVSHVSHVSHAESVFKEKLQGMSCLVTNTRTLAGLEALVQT